jgi:Rrf2 family nitric oxide-sensitive transcriptional repressor
MNLNKSTLIGLYATTTMAMEPGRRITASAIARAYAVSENHVAKVLQDLVRAKVAISARGAGGGFELAVDPADLTMLDVVEAIEGKKAGHCFGCDRSSSCVPAACPLERVLGEIGQQVYVTLASVTIASLARAPIERTRSTRRPRPSPGIR